LPAGGDGNGEGLDASQGGIRNGAGAEGLGAGGLDEEGTAKEEQSAKRISDHRERRFGRFQLYAEVYKQVAI
jgi:hypothetical protein